MNKKMQKNIHVLICQISLLELLILQLYQTSRAYSLLVELVEILTCFPTCFSLLTLPVSGTLYSHMSW